MKTSQKKVFLLYNFLLKLLCKNEKGLAFFVCFFLVYKHVRKQGNCQILSITGGYILIIFFSNKNFCIIGAGKINDIIFL